MTPLARQSCAEHPERHGHAICMSCRRTICQECTTQWEGINYCPACVGVRAAAAARPSGGWMPMALMLGLAAMALVAVVKLIVVITVFLVGAA